MIGGVDEDVKLFAWVIQIYGQDNYIAKSNVSKYFLC